MELHGLASRIEQRAHLRDFLLEVIEIGFALRMIERDDGGAAAEPAERFAERDVEVDRQIAVGLVVLEGDGVRQEFSLLRDGELPVDAEDARAGRDEVGPVVVRAEGKDDDGRRGSPGILPARRSQRVNDLLYPPSRRLLKFLRRQMP